MANRKSKGKNNGRNKSSAIPISEEDAALLEKAKQASKAGELDLAEYRRLLEEDLKKEIENKMGTENLKVGLRMEKKKKKEEIFSERNTDKGE